MENKSFKSVAFGGFDKEEVIQYIQQAAQEAAAAQETLARENADLRAENSTLKEQLAQCTRERENAAREDGERHEKEVSALKAELEKLRPDAEAYQKVRDQVGDIECQARKRACELEASTTQRLNELVSNVQKQYQGMARAFNITAEQLTAELRKVEVNLSQLPRAMDQTGTELNDLASSICSTGE